MTVAYFTTRDCVFARRFLSLTIEYTNTAMAWIRREWSLPKTAEDEYDPMITESHTHRHTQGASSRLVGNAIAELRRSTCSEVRRVRCDAHGFVFAPRGPVSRYFYKQLAQAVLINRLPQQMRIENDLHVCSEPRPLNRRGSDWQTTERTPG